MKKIGCFDVSDCFFEDLTDDEGTNLFHRMVVLEARRDARLWRTTYIAYHPDFDEVQEGHIIPLYRAEFFPESTYPKWVKLGCDDVMIGVSR